MLTCVYECALRVCENARLLAYNHVCIWVCVFVSYRDNYPYSYRSTNQFKYVNNGK